MPKPHRSGGVSAEQARQALAFLVQEGKLAVNDIRRALQRRDRLVRDLRRRLAEIGGGMQTAGRRIQRRVATRFRAAEQAARSPRRRAKRSISAATRNLYRLQGKYMSALRPLSKAARAKVKAVRQSSGIQAAISAAKRMGK